MKTLRQIILPATAALLLAGCTTGNDGWTLRGEAPAGVETVYLQAPTNAGGWYTLDSAKVSSGKYHFSESRANSQIFAVKLGDNTVYIPADSTETIELTADGVRSGSAEADLFNKVESVYASGGDGHELLQALDGNYASTAAYYATRLVKDRLLIRTVANRYNEECPNDPRTAILRAEFGKMTPRGEAPIEQKVIYADEIGYYDIELMDRNGKMHKLSDIVDANPLTVLAYVDFTSSDTPAITRALGDARSAGAEIYEVGFCDNQHLWAIASEGLPWTNVYQSDAADRVHISQYAVGTFPTFFIIKNGEIVERVTDYTKLATSIKQHK